jgi:hypothetical protein
MSRATLLPPARTLALLAVAFLVAAGAALAIGAAPAAAAKPCWQRALDDWADNGRVDGVYSQACIQAAINHLPEDLRIYSNAEEMLRGSRQPSVRERLPQGSFTTGSDAEKRKAAPVREIEPRTDLRDEGPFQSVLSYRTNDASSIPLPLIILAGLAMVLMAVGGAAFAHRKLQARRISSGPS